MKTTKQFMMLCCLMVMAATGYAQEWEIDYGDATSYTILRSGIVNDKGEAVLVGNNGPDNNHYYPMIMRVADDGEYDYIVFDTIEGNVKLYDIIQLNNGNYFASACVNPDLYGEGEAIVFMVFDSNFNIVEIKRYEKQGNALTIGGGQLLLDNDGTVIVSGSYQYQDTNGLRNKPYFYRLDENADSLSCRYVTATMPQPEAHIGLFSCFQLLKNPTSEGFVVLCEGLNNSCSLLLYDSDFNYEFGFILGHVINSTPPEVETFHKVYCDHWLTDNKLLLMGTMWPIDDFPEWHIGMAEINLDGTCNRWETVYYKQDTAVEAALPCMAYVNDSTIYGASSFYKDIGGINSTSVCLYDTDMELLGRKEFVENEYFNLSACFILPLHDGCCLVVTGVGTYYLGDYDYGKIIKLCREDFNPIPCGVMEVSQEAIKALVYPNPAKEKVTIDGIEVAEVQVYNAFGQVVKTVRNSNEISVENMARGVYLLRISDVNGTTKTKRITVTK